MLLTILLVTRWLLLCVEMEVREAEEFMRHMSRIGPNPNSITFDCVISGYGNLGDGLKAFSLFDEMVKLGNTPSFFHIQQPTKRTMQGRKSGRSKEIFEQAALHSFRCR